MSALFAKYGLLIIISILLIGVGLFLIIKYIFARKKDVLAVSFQDDNGCFNCVNCGSKLKADAQFCTKCGSKANPVINNSMSSNSKASKKFSKIRLIIGIGFLLIGMATIIIPIVASLIINLEDDYNNYESNINGQVVSEVFGSDFDGWQDAYIKYIDYLSSDSPYASESQRFRFEIVYLDDDEQPELWIELGYSRVAEQVITFDSSKKQIKILSLPQLDSTYYPYSGLIYYGATTASTNPVEYYKLYKNNFYKIEDSSLNQEGKEASFIGPDSKDEMLELLKNSESESIVGMWGNNGSDVYAYKFYKDGRGKYNVHDFREFTYLDDGKKLSITFLDNSNTVIVPYSISEDTLTVKDSSGENVVYKRLY